MTTSNPLPRLSADGGSFRDSVNRVYLDGGRVLRGLDSDAAAIFERLSREDFYARLLRKQTVIPATLLDATTDPSAAAVLSEGWAAAIEHERIPFISYAYEWPFSMLKDAALLHLRIIEEALENGWTLKDATPYNIQWRGSGPVFIDTPSLEPRGEGQPWIGYRQFCSMFVIPLMLRAHLGIDPAPLLRSKLDGIPPLEAAPYFRGLSRLRRGVLSHVFLSARVEAGIARRERDTAPAQNRQGGRHSKAMVVGLVQSLARLVRGLKSPVAHTDWSHYAGINSYDSEAVEAKKAFVARHSQSRRRGLVWDLGCNTGTFSQIAAENSDYVVSIDGDGAAIEQLYLDQKAKAGNAILPLVGDLANLSPDQGWAGRERRTLEHRGRPALVLALALIHHIRVSANVPIPMFLDWLRSLDAEVIIEFVDRSDEMFVKLIANKSVDYPDYTLDNFVAAAQARFTIADRQKLKDGRREIFLLAPA